MEQNTIGNVRKLRDKSQTIKSNVAQDQIRTFRNLLRATTKEKSCQQVKNLFFVLQSRGAIVTFLFLLFIFHVQVHSCKIFVNSVRCSYYEELEEKRCGRNMNERERERERSDARKSMHVRSRGREGENEHEKPDFTL